MDKGFWGKLNKPFFALAPMADVSDAAYRRIVAKYGNPDVIYTEFVPCDGLCSRGKDFLIKDLEYDESERPVVAQFFGANPKHFYECARLAVKLGFDGIDINMGCPEKNIQKQGAGAALIKTPELAKEIILATKEGVKSTGKEIPVSVKTRIGYLKNEIDQWLPNILETEPAAVIIHGRTKKEMSKVDAHWDIIGEAVKIAKGSDVIIVGNGDVKNLADGREKAKKYGVDGIMIGRGVFGNPWVFRKDGYVPSFEEKLKVMIEHTYLFEKLLIGRKRFDLMKKHYRAYVSGFDGANALRIKFMSAKNGKEVEEIANKYLKELNNL